VRENRTHGLKGEWGNRPSRHWAPDHQCPIDAKSSSSSSRRRKAGTTCTLPGLHTQGENLEGDATESAREALALYVEGLREDGRGVETGVVRRVLAIPA